MKQLCAIAAASLLTVASAASAQTVVVNGTGTPYTASSSSDNADPTCSAATNTWCGRNVRNNASVGQTTARPRSGNGSLAFSSPDGSGKADFEYYLSANTQFKLSSLQNMSYDYFRDATSNVGAQLVPSLRILISQGTFTGALVFEPVYNGEANATVGSWKTESIGGSTDLWLSQFGCPGGSVQEVYNITLSTWQSAGGSASKCGGFNFNGDATVIGFSTGVGSGWNGSFNGAVDNISYKTSAMNQATTFNFEVAAQSTVPEPSTYALMVAGLAAVAVVARRRKLS